MREAEREREEGKTEGCGGEGEDGKTEREKVSEKDRGKNPVEGIPSCRSEKSFLASSDKALD